MHRRPPRSEDCRRCDGSLLRDAFPRRWVGGTSRSRRSSHSLRPEEPRRLRGGDTDRRRCIGLADHTDQTFEVVYCEADVPTGCEDFTKNHFLSLLLGVKVTGMGRLEYLHYAGTEEASVTARYDDGTEKTFELDPVGGNGRYTTIEVSPEHFAKEGAELMEYTVKAGGRFQEYEVDSRRTDCAPVLLFVNSFGVDELIYCTGTATKAPSFKRESAYIRGVNRNYAITETRTFKADTGILTEDMADWFGEVLRSGCVRIVTFSNGKPNVGKEVVITESKSEQSNDPDELTRFTFSYQYAQRNHNVVEMEREGRVFDNKIGRAHV